MERRSVGITARWCAERMTFDTKVAVVLESELALWQKVNATAFLVSGFAADDASLVGEPYVDASGNRYLPMLRQPIVVYAGDAAEVRVRMQEH